MLVAQGARLQDRQIIAVGFKGHTRAELISHVQQLLWLRLGQLNKMISYLKQHQVQELVLAGGINKPRALDIRLDFKAARLLLQTWSKNDNALFQALIKVLRQEGLSVVSPLSFVPELHTPAGVLTKRKPDKQERTDIAFGWSLAKDIGRLDIGQCLVVKKQMVVAVEAMEGTNAAILRAGELAGKGCVVLKVFKPGQEEHIDQPAVGLETIKTMLQAQASCLAIEADKSLFFDRKKALQLADQEGICVLGKQV